MLEKNTGNHQQVSMASEFGYKFYLDKPKFAIYVKSCCSIYEIQLPVTPLVFVTFQIISQMGFDRGA